MPQKQRDVVFDIYKGILILFVVLGHSGFEYKYIIYWFHMPLFFLISGTFFQPIDTKHNLKLEIYNSFKKLMIPYLVYLSVFNLVFVGYKIYQGESLLNILTYSGSLLYGGRYLVGINGVFWFISVLFISRIIVFLIFFYRKRIYLVSIFLLLIGVFESILFTHINRIDFPLNADVALVSQFYLVAGYFLYNKNFYNSITKIHFIVAIFLAIFFFLLTYFSFISFTLDMKYSIYRNPILIIIIPFIFHVIFYFVSKEIKNIKLLLKSFSFLGKASLLIMFLHVPTTIIIEHIFNIRLNSAFYLLAGTLFPLLIWLILKTNKYLRLYFLGEKIKDGV